MGRTLQLELRKVLEQQHSRKVARSLVILTCPESCKARPRWCHAGCVRTRLIVWLVRTLSLPLIAAFSSSPWHIQWPCDIKLQNAMIYLAMRGRVWGITLPGSVLSAGMSRFLNPANFILRSSTRLVRYSPIFKISTLYRIFTSCH